MSKEYLLIAVLIVHWVADFILQTDRQALNKSKSNKWLTCHIATYTSVMAVAFGFKFGLVNGLLHWITDYGTSRASSIYWARGQRKNFFIVIGLDQLMHTIFLIINLDLATGGVFELLVFAAGKIARGI